MNANQITWENFALHKYDSRGIRYKFEDLCRQLFTYEFLSQNKDHKYIHSNPNNPGIESEPIWDEVNEIYIGYQCKYFDHKVNYSEIKKSVDNTIQYYEDKLDKLYLFSNKTISTNSKTYQEIKKNLLDKKIELELITDTMILDLCRKYPLLGVYYFGNHNITHEWFVGKFNYAKNILGTRFNDVFNVDTKSSLNLSIFSHDQNAVDYFNKKKCKAVEDINELSWKSDEIYNCACDLSNFIKDIPDVTLDCLIDVEQWHKKVNDTFADVALKIHNKISEIENDLVIIDDKNRKKRLNKKLQKLEKFIEFYGCLKLSDDEKSLLEYKFLAVKGDAGVGKSQLFANETNTLLNSGRNALLILGGTILSDQNLFEQLKDNLRIDFKFEDLIDILEAFGEKEERIMPIFIDALNETWNIQLWKLNLPVLYKYVCDKRYVRIAISYRGEYEKLILNDTFLSNPGVFLQEHKGFSDDSLEAVKQFLDHNGIPFSPFFIFNSKLTNPLFLSLYCKTFNGEEVSLHDLYDHLLECVDENVKLSMRRAIVNQGLASDDNLVFDVVKAISKLSLQTGKIQFKIKEIENLSIWNSLNLSSRAFITQLTHENILHDFELNGIKYIYFAYDQMNDYFSAKTIFSEYQSKSAVRKYLLDNVLKIVKGKVGKFENIDLFIHCCALYANKFKAECIDIIQTINDPIDKKNIVTKYIRSFEWRNEIYFSFSEFCLMCKDYEIDYLTEWNAFINNSLKINHLLNADALHTVLMNFSLAERDYVWTIYINGMSSYENRIVQLIELYNNGGSIQFSDEKQIRLLLILLSWFLTSSNRRLRDITSKSMVEILREHFNYAEFLLNLFAKVNDPYVLQRLYGVVFGACLKRVNECKKDFKFLSIYCYKQIFDNECVYPDILLRDYARLIIERYIFEYPEDTNNFDLEKIKPPYHSIQIPEIEENYLEKHYDKGLAYIKSSMRFDGMGMYGDFGRYVFQRSLQNFSVDQKKIYNYAMHFIIHDLEYDGDLFDDYEELVNRFTYSRQIVTKTERIGKKYQWIALYNILARVTDCYPMKNSDYTNDVTVKYDGPWDPFVRDFDPTLNDKLLKFKDVPTFSDSAEHVKDSIYENKEIMNVHKFDKTKWLNSKSSFFRYQKEDLLLTDDNGNKWVTLSKYVDTGRDNLKHDKFIIWNHLYGFFVNDNQLTILKKYAREKIELFDSSVFTIPNSYNIFNKEYPWSSACNSILENQYIDVEINTGDKQTLNESKQDLSYFDLYLEELFEHEEKNIDQNSTTVIDIPDFSNEYKTIQQEMPVTINIGKILRATQYISWEQEYDASKSETISIEHPCAEIINTLKLRQKQWDGYYFNNTDELIAFDSELTKQNVGLVIRKDALDNFLEKKNYHLVWLVDASKEIHDATGMVTDSSEWTGVLEYTNDSVQGEAYVYKIS